MDTISVGNTIAAAMEMYEKGYIPEKDIGFALNFGDAQAMAKLVEMTAYRKGFGNVIADSWQGLMKVLGEDPITKRTAVIKGREGI